jgi:hypothetical protein
MLCAAIELIMFNRKSNFPALRPIHFKIIESYIQY